jgi:hypothetical protein
LKTSSPTFPGQQINVQTNEAYNHAASLGPYTVSLLCKLSEVFFTGEFHSFQLLVWEECDKHFSWFSRWTEVTSQLFESKVVAL